MYGYCCTSHPVFDVRKQTSVPDEKLSFISFVSSLDNLVVVKIDEFLCVAGRKERAP